MDVEKLKARFMSLKDDKSNEKIISFLRTKLPYLREIEGDKNLDDIYGWEAEEDGLFINFGVKVTYEFLCYDDQELRKICDEYKKRLEHQKDVTNLKNFITLLHLTAFTLKDDVIKEVIDDTSKESILEALNKITNLVK